MAIFIVMALPWLPARASGGSETLPMGSVPPCDSLTVSIVTCWPGPEIYELYGHEAIRVKGCGIDSVWNYGVFDFNTPNFIYRFVKGETDYICAGYPFEWFMPEYVRRGSKVVEQELNLSPGEAQSLLAKLRENALPENRTYRYKYVSDNCATRVRDMVEASTGGKMTYPDSVSYGTSRNAMRHYNRNYPWYQFGIDIALGSGIDLPVTAREEMFVPVEMSRMFSGAKMADGRIAVRSERVLNEGVADAVRPPTPWWLAPFFWSWTAFGLGVAFCIVSIVKGKIWRWVYSLWFTLTGIAGCLVAFLVFVSSHEATSPNALLLWLNPLQLLFGIGIWWRRMRWACKGVAWYDIAVVACMLAVWPFQAQSANPAFFPLLGVTLALSAAYAILAGKESYNNYKDRVPAPKAEERKPRRKRR